MMKNNTLTALRGVRVGHATQKDKLTGCTVVLFDEPYPVAYKSYGGAPGTFGTDALRNGMTFFDRHGLFIAGGSLTGLMSASEIMQAMIEDGVGFKSAEIINPAISGAVVFDMGIQKAQYDPKNGREAYKKATTSPVESGNVGAGTGTSVGKFHYLKEGTQNGGMKAGVGSARIDLGNGVMVCALSVVNALGNVIRPDGTVLAGNRDEIKDFISFEDVTEYVTSDKTNTTISIVGINIDLKTRENYERIAHIASHGQVRAIQPVHTSIDGDTVFVFSTKEKNTILNKTGGYVETDDWPLFTIDLIANAAAKAVQESIYDACLQAESVELEGAYQNIIPSAKDFGIK